jgi:hypothetical protein
MSSPLDHISKGPLPHPPVDNLDHGPVDGIVSKPVDVGPLPGESNDVDGGDQANADVPSQPTEAPVDEPPVVAASVEDTEHTDVPPVEKQDIVTDPAGSKSEDVGLSTDGPAVLIDDKPTGQTVEVVDSATTA